MTQYRSTSTCTPYNGRTTVQTNTSRSTVLLQTRSRALSTIVLVPEYEVQVQLLPYSYSSTGTLATGSSEHLFDLATWYNVQGTCTSFCGLPIQLLVLCIPGTSTVDTLEFGVQK
jgi:hypothetical protein